ncbi:MULTISPECIES: hypothetical protein [Spirosoma]|uniref:Uncharacterized protein n=2 Tax=Spirosoma TaxID=107 RepID=A0A6G9AVK9_9BACT|nr:MULTISPECIES: hypothetical protein [Spirosoma]QHV96191.1 hypothetical protein GJR95_14760 [Spirosoma endbachense]QIP16325.1 hypothetical protein G8759_28650 [Spirosoma aureum]
MQAPAQNNRLSVKVQRVVNLNAIGTNTASTKSGQICDWFTIGTAR